MKKSLFLSQIYFFDLDRNHKPSLTLGILCAKREKLYPYFSRPFSMHFARIVTYRWARDEREDGFFNLRTSGWFLCQNKKFVASQLFSVLYGSINQSTFTKFWNLNFFFNTLRENGLNSQADIGSKLWKTYDIVGQLNFAFILCPEGL